MSDIHVNYDNIKALLIGIKQNLNQSINNIDLSDEQKNLILKAEKLKIDGDGNSYLSDNGTYKPINLKELETMYTKITDVYNMFKITDIPSIEGIWSTGPAMNIKRNASSSCKYEDNIYVFGGVADDAGNSPTNKVEIYNIKTNSWTYGTDMSYSAGWLSTIINNKKIYCIGGWNNDTLNVLRIYDIESNTWSIGANILSPTNALACETNNNKIYCIGGGNNGAINSNYIYDIESNTWSIGANISIPTVALDSVIYNKKIYCIGGFTTIPNYLNKVEVYDIESNSWSSVKEMITPRRGLSCQIYKNYIYCIGGTNNTVLDIIEVYDITNNTWMTVDARMPTPRYALTTQIINNKIYCIGGYNTITSFNTLEIFTISLNFLYDITLPIELQSKVDIIKSDGLGNKLLADNGTYIEYIPSGYRELDAEELDTLINELKTI